MLALRQMPRCGDLQKSPGRCAVELALAGAGMRAKLWPLRVHAQADGVPRRARFSAMETFRRSENVYRFARFNADACEAGIPASGRAPGRRPSQFEPGC